MEQTPARPPLRLTILLIEFGSAGTSLLACAFYPLPPQKQSLSPHPLYPPFFVYCYRSDVAGTALVTAPESVSGTLSSSLFVLPMYFFPPLSSFPIRLLKSTRKSNFVSLISPPLTQTWGWKGKREEGGLPFSILREDHKVTYTAEETVAFPVLFRLPGEPPCASHSPREKSWRLSGNSSFFTICAGAPFKKLTRRRRRIRPPGC